LLTVAIATFGAVAYTAVRRSDLDTAWARLQNVTERLAATTRVSMADRLRRVREVAEDSATVAAFQSAEGLSAGRRVLSRLGPDTGAAITTMLQDPAGHTVAALEREVAGLFAERRDTAAVSPIVVRGDSLLLEFSAPVHEGNRLLGHVVQLRTLRSAPAVVKTLNELVGSEAKLYIGNRDGSVWTDLVEQVRQSPTLAGNRGRYLREGRMMLATSAPIGGSPYLFVVEFPEDRVLAKSRSLLWILVGIGALIIGGGALAGWLLTRRITIPLAEMTAAAERISSGAAAGTFPPVTTEDEIGRLDQSFRVMAESVRQARENLEEQVRDRTRALELTRDALVRKERMAVLGQLASSVGHELRNPLGVISNVVYYLNATLKNTPGRVHEHLRILSEQVKLAEKIIADILDFTRAKPPEVSEVPIAQFLDEQIPRVTLPSGIRIERDLDPDLAPMQVDRVQVGQVFINVLTNAVQAMDGKGGILTIRARSDHGRVRLEVEDDGPGVPDEHLERIFEPLFTTKSRGFGLGLSVSRSLAQANGGDLTVSNAPDGGAIFVIDLPAAGVTV
jgi:signal transduction histidine kinase